MTGISISDATTNKNIRQSHIEDATRRFEVSAKSGEELAEAVFEALLNDDGTMKDFGRAFEINEMIHDEGLPAQSFMTDWNVNSTRYR